MRQIAERRKEMHYGWAQGATKGMEKLGILKLCGFVGAGKAAKISIHLYTAH